MVKGKTVSVREIRKACENHLLKQKWGHVSVVQRHSGLRKLLQVISRALPQSKEIQDAQQDLDELTELQKARAPQDRHGQRMKAFYVEPNDLGTDWNKPWEKDKEEAQHFVQDASNDYSLQLDKLTNLDNLRFNDSELADAIKAWEERPSLPPRPSLY